MSGYASRAADHYWNSYYTSKVGPGYPSQFAAFVMAEASGSSLIVDCGCGNGRDSFFFARHGFNVIGVDGSQAAIHLCNNAKRDANLGNVSFVHLNFSDADAVATAAESMCLGSRSSVVLYARFFLHALEESALSNFFAFAHTVCRQDGRFAVEFRTDRDRGLQKVTEEHFRNFIDPLEFRKRVTVAGFEPLYEVEGFGFAKYKEDDAYVFRGILRYADK